ncbi:unnamed protein product [Calypogeia fissa]
MLELNLNTTLIAKVGWKPEKALMPIGPQILCTSCQCPRSVTMMGADGKCGLCIATDYESQEQRQERIEGRVAKTNNETTEISWVECSVRTCRAQYVLYHPDMLCVRPKCYYCREKRSTAPCVECKLCLSRFIWPEEYRKGDMTDFKCIACSVNRKTIIEVETSASNLSEENGLAWLLRNENGKIQHPLNGRSLFHLISTAGVSSFCEDVSLFPTISTDQKLTLHGKVIHNFPELRCRLMSWVSRRRTEKATCSLCFSSTRKTDVLPACGRSGCHQRICKDCLGGWYGLNAPGRVINTAALNCPFCRRSPTTKTLAKHGTGVHSVGDLRVAVERSGEWIYAWCSACGYARQHTERVCAAGAPPELVDGKCEDCLLNMGILMKTKECPGCGALTQKRSGCNHITCVVPNCGAHWCFECGGRFDEGEIYGHMQAEHGGFYGAEEEDGYYYGGESDDEEED